MSADFWTDCPVCKKKDTVRFDNTYDMTPNEDGTIDFRYVSARCVECNKEFKAGGSRGGVMEQNKWQHWQVVQKCRELGKLCDETDYGQEKYQELEQMFVEYLTVGDYLEARFNGVDLAKNGCPVCKNSSDVLEICALYEKLSEDKKKMAMRFLMFLLHDA